MFKEESMTKGQLRYQLRKEGYLLRKRGYSYMIIEGERNWVIAGGDGNGYSLTLNEASEYAQSTPSAAK